MSDEYTSNQASGYRGSLVNDTVESREIPTGNYPPPQGDTTSSGGYGSPPGQNVWSDRNQRGLVDQSTSGGDLGGELQDAKQGRDDALPVTKGAAGYDEYGSQSWESKAEAERKLAAHFRMPDNGARDR